jgi:hypothetical protein
MTKNDRFYQWCKRHPVMLYLLAVAFTVALYSGSYAFGYYAVFPIWNLYQ